MPRSPTSCLWPCCLAAVSCLAGSARAEEPVKERVTRVVQFAKHRELEETPAASHKEYFLQSGFAAGVPLDQGALRGWYGKITGSFLARWFPWRVGVAQGVDFSLGAWHGSQATSYTDMAVYYLCIFHLGHFEPGVQIGTAPLFIDRRNDAIGFGLYSPRGAASLGLRLGSFRISGEVDVSYRWAWGIADVWVPLFGLRLDFMSESLTPTDK